MRVRSRSTISGRHVFGFEHRKCTLPLFDRLLYWFDPVTRKVEAGKDALFKHLFLVVTVQRSIHSEASLEVSFVLSAGPRLSSGAERMPSM